MICAITFGYKVTLYISQVVRAIVKWFERAGLCTVSAAHVYTNAHTCMYMCVLMLRCVCIYV